MVPRHEARVIEGEYTDFSAPFLHIVPTDVLLMSPKSPPDLSPQADVLLVLCPQLLPSLCLTPVNLSTL